MYLSFSSLVTVENFQECIRLWNGFPFVYLIPAIYVLKLKFFSDNALLYAISTKIKYLTVRSDLFTLEKDYFNKTNDVHL